MIMTYGKSLMRTNLEDKGKKNLISNFFGKKNLPLDFVLFFLAFQLSAVKFH